LKPAGLIAGTLAPLVALAAALALDAGPALAQLPGSGHVAATLVSEQESVAPGLSVSVGLRLVHEPQWHTYWIVPGDAGLPTQLQWKLPPGFSAGPLQWPLPQLLRVGDLANYGYEGTVLLPATLQVPASAQDGSVLKLAAHAAWLVCKDVCIPENADLQLSLPVQRAASAMPGRWHDEFAAARARIPQPLTLADGAAMIDGERIRLQFVPAGGVTKLAFFPLEASRVRAAAPQRLASTPGRVTLDLAAETPLAADFTTLRGVLVADDGPDLRGGRGWAGVIELPLKHATLPMSQAPAPPSPGSPVAPVPPASGAAPGAPSTTVWVAVLGAFLGGLILNLMPCVFPVLSLKLLALVQHRERGDPSLASHGLAFAAGTVTSFASLAAVLVALRAGGAQLGWGFQLQSPLVVALLTALFFGIGLNLLGAFDVVLGVKVLNSRTAQRFDGHHLTGSFATGVLAVVVASPCTAPFMGAALGFAAAQPAPVALGVFATLGFGMATPYLALTLAPKLLARLPRPGAWMEHLRQMMAFPMFVTCVWLLWVLAQQVDVDALAMVLGALVALALGAWAAGRAQRGARRFGWLGAAAALVALATLVSATARGTAPQDRPDARHAATHGWADWSETAQAQALASGRPVFVDFTAAWCVTCQANKRLVLYSPRVGAAFGAGGVTLLRADWTNRDDAIGRELNRFERNGVPLYVLYDGRGRPRVLPEILTEAVVLEALSRL
jgi:thiol:disulfide interchange protein/DsbC/DsbD-like thiol-disulfide interchange protein